VTSMVGHNVAQVVYAKTVTSGTCPCGSGNAHEADFSCVGLITLS